jgi:hypothetical protein
LWEQETVEKRRYLEIAEWREEANFADHRKLPKLN